MAETSELTPPAPESPNGRAGRAKKPAMPRLSRGRSLWVETLEARQMLYAAPDLSIAGPVSVAEDSGAHTEASYFNVDLDSSAEGGEHHVVTFQLEGVMAPDGLFESSPTVDENSGALSFTSAPQAFGTANLTLKVVDTVYNSGGAWISTSEDSEPFDIEIRPVNDEPTFSLAVDPQYRDLLVSEDSEPFEVVGFAHDASVGPDNESDQAITYYVSVDSSTEGLFDGAPWIDTDGTLHFTTVANASGFASLTVTADDGGGDIDGGDFQSEQNFTLTVDPVNDPPEASGNTVVTSEDHSRSFSSDDFPSADVEGDSVTSVTLSNFNLAGGMLQLGGVDVNEGQTIAVGELGSLVFTPAPDYFNAPAAGGGGGGATLAAAVASVIGFDFTVNDADPPNGTFAAPLSIIVTAINDAPTFSLPGNGDQLVEEDAGFQSSPDFLTNIMAGPSNEFGQMLTLSLTVTVAPEDAPLFESTGSPAIDESGTLTFTPAANASGTATVTVRLSDDGGTENEGVDYREESFTITITPVNDPPTIAGIPSDPVEYIENADAVPVFGELELADVDGDTVNYAAVMLSNASSDDELTWDDAVITEALAHGFTINHDFSEVGAGSSAELTFTGTAPIDVYQQLLRSVSFRSNSENPSAQERRIGVLVDDDIQDAIPAAVSDERTTIVTPVNDPPEPFENTFVTHEDQILQFQASDFAFFDAEGDLLSSITIRDLSQLNGGRLLLGPDDVAEGQEIPVGELGNLGFQPPLDAYGDDVASFSWSANDVDEGFGQATFHLNVTPVNDPPVISGLPVGPLTYVEGHGPLLVSGDIEVADVDGPAIYGATAEIVSGYHDGDVLSAGDLTAFGVSAVYDPGAHTLTFTGSWDAIESRDILKTYFETGDVPTQEQRIIKFTVWDSDDGLSASSQSIRVDVTPENDPPVITGLPTDPLSYTEGDDPLALSNDIDVTDAEDDGIVTLTVQILPGTGYVEGQDFLSGDTTGFDDVLATFDPATATLTITSTSGAKLPRNVLKSFFQTGDKPTQAQRTIRFTGTDFEGVASEPVDVFVTVTAVDDPPTITGLESPQAYNEDSPPQLIVPNIVVEDVDDDNLASATVSIDPDGYAADQDELQADNSGTHISVDFNPTTGELTLSGVASVADYQKVLRTVTYFNASARPSTSPRKVLILLTDGAMNRTASIDLAVVSSNDPPSIAGPASATTLEDHAVEITGISISDPDVGSPASPPGGPHLSAATAAVEIDSELSLSVSHGTLALHSTDRLILVSGSYGSASFTVQGSVADLNEALSTVTYTPDADYIGPDSLALLVNDRRNGGGSASMVDDKTIAITVIDNTAPVMVAAGVSGSGPDWNPAVNDALDPVHGLGAVIRTDGTVGVNEALPFTVLNRMRIRLNELEQVLKNHGLLTPAAFKLVGVTHENYEISSVVSDAATGIITIDFATIMDPDKLLLTGQVEDDAGNPLDISLRFDVLPGDVTRDGHVLGNDVIEVALRQGRGVDDPFPGYSPLHDVDGDGLVWGTDVIALQSRQFLRLPTGTPGVPDPHLSPVVGIPSFSADLQSVTPSAAIASATTSSADSNVGWIAPLVASSDAAKPSANAAAKGAAEVLQFSKEQKVDGAIAAGGGTASSPTASRSWLAADDRVDDDAPPTTLASIDAALAELWSK